MTLLAAISIDLVKSWIGQRLWWGAFISFLLLFACGLGLPMPEDVPLIVTGALIRERPEDIGALHAWLVVGGLNWLGIIGGDCCLYWIARRYGMGVTRLPVIGKHVTVDRIDKLRGWFAQYGIAVVGVGRLIAGVRGAMVVCAGVTKFHFGKFLIADGIAAFFSGGLFMLLGYWLGPLLNDETVKKYQHWFIAGAVLLVVLVVTYIVYKRRTHKDPLVPEPPAA
ncbi:MAG TPA: DedA family protein [Tepidisphaeraceae bacterium]|jgi:membrane protein DedA with SNARE-associated domain